MEWLEERCYVAYKVLDRERKHSEKEEAFEECATIRDAMQILNDYILGYTDYTDDTNNILYNTALYFGKFCGVESYTGDEGEVINEAMWMLEDCVFYFHLTDDQVSDLNKTLKDLNEI